MNLCLFYLCWSLLATGLGSCQQEVVEWKEEGIQVFVEKGEEWKHDFPLFLGIKIKNTPQIAIWLEDTEGNYLSTVYVTHRTANQAWRMAGGNRRKESLPHWAHTRAVQYADGLFLPTKEQPLTDGISGATPKGDFNVELNPTEGLQQFVVKIEVNHSVDFNEHYPKNAIEGEANYSGGKEGSGQPAVVYAATVDLSSPASEYEAVLIGHSSPDGSDGLLNPDLSQLTTALHIVKRITIHLFPSPGGSLNSTPDVD